MTLKIIQLPKPIYQLEAKLQLHAFLSSKKRWINCEQVGLHKVLQLLLLIYDGSPTVIVFNQKNQIFIQGPGSAKKSLDLYMAFNAQEIQGLISFNLVDFEAIMGSSRFFARQFQWKFCSMSVY